MPSIPDSAFRDRRSEKTEKSDDEHVLKVLDGEPEVSCFFLLISL